MITELIKEVGFPAFVVLILLYDKIKSNGSLIKVVENNNRLLVDIKQTLKGGKRK